MGRGGVDRVSAGDRPCPYGRGPAELRAPYLTAPPARAAREPSGMPWPVSPGVSRDLCVSRALRGAVRGTEGVVSREGARAPQGPARRASSARSFTSLSQGLGSLP